MSKKNRESHQRTPDIRWKPNVGENHLLQYVSIFFQIRNSFYNGLVLVQSFTSTQAATCRELQLSLILQLSWKGATTPFALALAKILVRRCWPTEGYNLFFLPGTTFHQFSNWIHEHHTIIKNLFLHIPLRPEARWRVTVSADPRRLAYLSGVHIFTSCVDLQF